MRKIFIFIILFICYANAFAQESKPGYTLKKLTELALTNSEILKSKQEDINEKKWTTEQSQKWQNPELGIKIGNTRQGADSSLNYEFSLSQPFYFPGKKNILASILTGEQRKTEITLEETKLWVFYEVIYLTYSYYHAKEYAKHLQEQKTRLETIEKFLNSRPIVSPQKIMEKNGIRQKILLIEKEHLNNLTRQKVLWEKLNLYLQLPAPIEIKLGWFKKKTDISFSNLLTKTVSKNFELQKQQEEINIAEFSKSLAEKDKYPDFALAAFFSETRSSSIERFFGGGISFFLPFWDRSTDKVKSFEAKIQSETYKKNYLLNNLKNNLQSALHEYQTKGQILAQFPVTLLKDVHTQMDYADSEFRKGRIELLSYLDAEETASQIHLEVFNSQLEFVKSYIEILMLSADKDFQEGDLYDL